MIKATFILYRKNGPLLSIPTAPAKGDLVYVDRSMYAGTLILIQRKNMK